MQDQPCRTSYHCPLSMFVSKGHPCLYLRGYGKSSDQHGLYCALPLCQPKLDLDPAPFLRKFLSEMGIHTWTWEVRSSASGFLGGGGPMRAGSASALAGAMGCRGPLAARAWTFAVTRGPVFAALLAFSAAGQGATRLPPVSSGPLTFSCRVCDEQMYWRQKRRPLQTGWVAHVAAGLALEVLAISGMCGVN